MPTIYKIIIGALVVETGIVGFFIYAILKMLDVCVIN